MSNERYTDAPRGNRPPAAEAPGDEKLRKFDELVSFCEDLKREGVITPGKTYTMNDEGKLVVQPIWPEEFKHEDITDMAAFEESVRDKLSEFYELRFALGEYFDFSSTEWNASTIGTVLKDIAEGLRRELTNIEVVSKGNEGLYDLADVEFFTESIEKLSDLIHSDRFARGSQSKKLSLVNQFADEFKKENFDRNPFQQYSEEVEFILAIDSRRRQRGMSPQLEQVITKIVDADRYDLLKKYFKEARRGS